MRLIDADALKEKIAYIYTLGQVKQVGEGFCEIVNSMPTIEADNDKLKERLMELNEAVLRMWHTQISTRFYHICDIATDHGCNFGLSRDGGGQYYLSMSEPGSDVVAYQLTNLDATDDYIMEFYPEEYDRVHEVIENERKRGE